VSQKDFKYFTR